MPPNGLIERLAEPNPYETQFKVARDFAELVLRNAPPAAVQVIATEKGYFVDHGIDHVRRIIDKLNALTSLLADPINIAETFILAVAAYYHDISMLIGRQGNENPEQVREEHHIRSAEIVQMLNDEHHLNINTHELDIIKKVIKAHRQIALSDLPPSQRIVGFEIRTPLLGAFLRIADSCDCDRSRAPKAIFDLFYDYIPECSKEYWKAHFPVTDVTFERRRASIVVSIDFSGGIRERVEKYRISNLLKRKLESELKSVEEVFQNYNIPVVNVDIRDFDTHNLIELSSPPAFENAATVILCSKSEKIDDLVNVVTPLVSISLEAVPLVIEFRPVEGPLFADTGTRIDVNRLDFMQSQLKEMIGNDLRGFESQAFEKIIIRRGIVG
ncbi:HD domain-containing protein [Candidatus Bathyarchaeota archaeon]|nr:HD domain-containing protein [Candidatus Bathyarchaeota archaeon]